MFDGPDVDKRELKSEKCQIRHFLGRLAWCFIVFLLLVRSDASNRLYKVIVGAIPLFAVQLVHVHQSSCHSHHDAAKTYAFRRRHSTYCTG